MYFMYKCLFRYSFIKSKCQCSCCVPKGEFASGGHTFTFLLMLFILSNQSQHAIDLYKLNHKLLFCSHCGLPQDRPPPPGQQAFPFTPLHGGVCHHQIEAGEDPRTLSGDASEGKRCFLHPVSKRKLVCRYHALPFSQRDF